LSLKCGPLFQQDLLHSTVEQWMTFPLFKANFLLRSKNFYGGAKLCLSENSCLQISDFLQFAY
jgi:hypothetical protein